MKGIDSMTKQEFEEKILLNKITAEEYEEKRLIKDIYLYFEFKTYVNIISKAMHESYNKSFFPSKKTSELITSVDTIKNMIHDENIEFKFLTQVKRKDLDVIFSKLGNESARHLFMGVIRRLYNYQEYTNYSIEDILGKADEISYVFELEKKDKVKFDVWCENHPEVNIEEERAKRTPKMI